MARSSGGLLSVRPFSWLDLSRVLVFLGLANLPFWVTGSAFLLQRPLVNLDPLLALLVAAWSPLIGGLVLLVVWGVDALTGLSFTFHFGTPGEFLRLLRFGTMVWMGDYISAASIAAVAVLLGIAVAAGSRLRKPVSPLAVVAVILVGALADVGNGTSFLRPRNDPLIAFNISGSGLGTMVVQRALAQDMGQVSPYPDSLPSQQLSALRDWAEGHPEGRIAVVVVESLGVVEDGGIQRWLEGRLVDGLPSSLQVSTGTLSSRGATTAAEIRTLCALQGAYYRLTAQNSAGCLARELQPSGWRTIALHGFTGRMFDRREWWPLLGFDELLFAEQLLKPNEAPCGLAFRGACDEAVLVRAAAALERPRSLAYVLTLNTHLPSAGAPPDSTLASMCSLRDLSAEVCRFTQALGNLLHSIRHVLVDGQSGNTALLVVGDHPPPFAKPTEREAFVQGRVPYVLILPR